MKYKIENQEYPVIIKRKKNKNTYIRITNNCEIYVTTSYFVSDNQIIKLLDQNKNYLQNNLERCRKQQEKNQKFYFLGICYNVILYDVKNVEIIDQQLYVKNQTMLDKWIQSETKEIFKEHLDSLYQLFEENIPYPDLKIRKMKTRWGVCNRKTTTVTLNSELIRYDLEKLDYVIIHELSHFVHFDHSKNFWNLVSKYCPRYKEIRKELRN